MNDTLIHGPVDCMVQGDCRDVLTQIPSDYFSACITDPPYNYEFIGRNWDAQEIDRRLERVQNSTTLVKNIPYGSGLAGGVRNQRWYNRIRQNILEYQSWCLTWAKQVFRTLRPGGFVLVFNSTRTVAHVQVALEEVGFYARDILVYRRRSGIPKGLNASKKLRAMGDEKWSDWEGWHSCLRNEWEAISLMQKPLIDNYVTTIRHSKVGLLHTEMEGDGFLSNIIDRFRKTEEDSFEGHCTIKPLELIKHLIRLTVPKNDKHVVLDPFAGTGTTCVAARELGHHYFGIETNGDYVAIAIDRLAAPKKADSRGKQGLLFTE